MGRAGVFLDRAPETAAHELDVDAHARATFSRGVDRDHGLAQQRAGVDERIRELLDAQVKLRRMHHDRRPCRHRLVREVFDFGLESDPLGAPLRLHREPRLARDLAFVVEGVVARVDVDRTRAGLLGRVLAGLIVDDEARGLRRNERRRFAPRARVHRRVLHRRAEQEARRRIEAHLVASHHRRRRRRRADAKLARLVREQRHVGRELGAASAVAYARGERAVAQSRGLGNA